MLSLYLNHDKGMNWEIAIPAGVAAIFCWWKWSTIMILAAKTLKLGI